MRMLIALSALLILFVGCEKSNVNSSTTNPASHGGLTLAFQKSTIPSNVASVVAILSRDGYDPLHRSMNFLTDTSAEVLFDEVAVGTWKLEVSAYSPDSVLKYQGTTTVIVFDGETTIVNLNMVPVSSGVGAVKIVVTWGTTGKASLISWWPGDGNAKDSISGNNGWLENGASFIAGKKGLAFTFDGYDDVVSVPDTSMLNFGTGSFSISAWVRVKSFHDYSTIVSKRLERTNWQGWWFGVSSLNGGGGWRFEYGYDHSFGELLSDSVITIGAFTHIVIVVDKQANQLTMYVNGKKQSSPHSKPDISGIGSINSTEPLRIGRGGLNMNTYDYVPLHGDIDEVKIFKGALTESEVQLLYHQ